MQPWNACMLEPNFILKWIECHPGLAGYVQAIGVLATVMIALLGPPLVRWIERRRTRIARHEATTAIIFGSKEHVQTLLQRVDGRLATIDTYAKPEGADINLVIHNVMIEIPGALDMQFVSDEGFERNRLQFLHNLVIEARRYNMEVNAVPRDNLADDAWSAFRRQIRSHLEELNGRLVSALDTIEREQH